MNNPYDIGPPEPEDSPELDRLHDNLVNEKAREILDGDLGDLVLEVIREADMEVLSSIYHESLGLKNRVKDLARSQAESLVDYPSVDDL